MEQRESEFTKLLLKNIISKSSNSKRIKVICDETVRAMEGQLKDFRIEVKDCGT